MYKTHQPHFWKLRCRKSARRCGAKHISKSEVQETAGHGALLDVQMPFRVAGARECAPDGRRGTFEEDLQRCISRGRRSTKDMFMRDVRRSGCWFHERGCILEYQILRWTTTRLCTPIFTRLYTHFFPRLYTHENHDHDHGDHHHHHHHQGVSCNLQGCRSLAPARWRLPDRPRVVSSAPRPRTSARPGAVTWPLPAGRAWHPDVRHDIGWCLHFCFVRSSWRPDLIPPWSACCFGHPHPSRRPTRMSTGTSSLDWRWPGAANGEPWARPLWSVGGLVLLLSALPACGSGHFRSYVGVAVGFIGLRGGPRWPGAAACTDIVGMLASASARLLILGQPLARPSAANGPQAIDGGPPARERSPAPRRDSRVLCPVPNCPAGALGARGWTSHAAMRPHLEDHAAGTLDGEVPAAYSGPAPARPLLCVWRARGFPLSWGSSPLPPRSSANCCSCCRGWGLSQRPLLERSVCRAHPCRC